MKAARIAVLGVAITAGLGAAYLMTGTKEPPPTVVMAPPPPPQPTEAVLVASKNLNFGAVIADGDIKWQSWPPSQVPAGTITRSTQPDALQSFMGAIVRATFLAGDPIHPDRLVRAGGSGFMSAVLGSGMRAVAIDLIDQGKSAAGGFILPNDRVDIIRTFRPDDAPSAFASETILTNIRVLAIGQSVQEKGGERTVIGSTATLEMTPAQAEKVVLAQRTGTLTLSLRSLADSAKENEPGATLEQPRTMTVIRSGNASQARVQ